MSLDKYVSPAKPRPSLKSSLKRMRSIWLRGPVDRFDLKLARILDCSLKDAAKVRESWLNMGFLAYDKRGLLCWRVGGS